MKKGIDLAHDYYRASNESDFTAIKRLLHPKVCYISQNVGKFEGLTDVIEMQETFHRQHRNMEWAILEIEEREDDENTITVEFEFTGKRTNGEHVLLTGTEIIVTDQGKIESITIYNH